MLALLIGAARAALPDVDEPLRTGATAPDDAAVVIGIEDYVFLPDVPYAQRDARAMYDFFVSTRGIPVERVIRVDGGAKEQIAAAVERAAGLARGGQGTVWIYFAGHGVAAPSSGRRLLLGDDARQDPAVFEARGIPVDDLIAAARGSGAQVAVLVDACFNGASRGGGDVVSGTRFAVPSWAPKEAAGTLSWFASGPDELARPLPAVEHGAFTWLALGALRGWADGEVDGQRDGQVTADEASLFLARALPRVGIGDQEPVLTAEAPRAWVLSTGTDPRPELSLDSAEPAEPRPTGFAPGSGLVFDPNLLATAQTYGVTLPLREYPLGLHKDTAGKWVNGQTYRALVRSTPAGRRATTRLYTGGGLLGLGAAGVMTTSVVGGMTGDSAVFLEGGIPSAALLVTGVGFAISGASGIQRSLQPADPTR